ncbi:hypothetical protein WS48_07510 [Burkholderia sp. RF7-non_BP1]|nr:hypothetical protein WS46_10770 [Burkholderia sp. RF4-BP95]KUZ00903.1 hypothetical protein WS48_07510 [Burkholderia sp. RF7-non_BP1]KUZ04679.1 hypothetical protein WS49_10060 [Burkholderia sp. RF7-non_BP4]
MASGRPVVPLRAYACPRAGPARGIGSHAHTECIRVIVASFRRMNDTAKARHAPFARTTHGNAPPVIQV